MELGAFAQIRQVVERDWNAFSGFALERYFAAKFAETGGYTRIGRWWDRKGENEIDLVAENEIERTATFCEIKRNPGDISISTLNAKREAFLRATGAYGNGWRTDCRALSLSDM